MTQITFQPMFFWVFAVELLECFWDPIALSHMSHIGGGHGTKTKKALAGDLQEPCRGKIHEKMGLSLRRPIENIGAFQVIGGSLKPWRSILTLNLNDLGATHHICTCPYRDIYVYIYITFREIDGNCVSEISRSLHVVACFQTNHVCQKGCQTLCQIECQVECQNRMSED